MKKLLLWGCVCTIFVPVLSEPARASADDVVFDLIDDPDDDTEQAAKTYSEQALAAAGSAARYASDVAKDAAKYVAAKATELYTSVYNNTPDAALVGFKGLVSRGPSRLVLIEPGAYKNVLHSGDTLVVRLMKFTQPPVEIPISARGYSKVAIKKERTGKIIAVPS